MAADDVENQMGSVDVFKDIVLEVDGLPYLLLHTGNRIDAVLGAAVFDQTLLPTRYFENRPTGVITSRLRGVENIHEFIASAVVTLVLDLQYLGVFIAVMLAYDVALTVQALSLIALIDELPLDDASEAHRLGSSAVELNRAIIQTYQFRFPHDLSLPRHGGETDRYRAIRPYEIACVVRHGCIVGLKRRMDIREGNVLIVRHHKLVDPESARQM